LAFREIKPKQPTESFFEDTIYNNISRGVSPKAEQPGTQPSTALASLRLSLPSLKGYLHGFNTPLIQNPGSIATKAGSIATKVTITSLAKLAVAIALIWFGATTTGSFYGPASGKFAGVLATIFYQYQAGLMLEFVGIVVIYDQIKKLF
jgi:hypothetical protein